MRPRLRPSVAAPALAATAVLACADAPTAAQRSATSLRTARAGATTTVGRPFKGECDVNARFAGETTLEFSGTCQLAHLGRVTVVASQSLVPGPDGLAFTNTATYTAANGDALYTTDVGVGTPTPDGLAVLLAATQTVTGGTGRFAGASGTATLRGRVEFTGPGTTTGGYTLDGQLTY